MLTLSIRTREIAHRAETVDQTTITVVVVVDTHALSSNPFHRLVLDLNSLQLPVLVGKTPMPLTEATTITWRCGMLPWRNNNSNNKVQVSKPDRQVLDDDFTCLDL